MEAKKEKNPLSDPRLKQEVFRAPEAYFDSLPKRIEERIREKAAPKPLWRTGPSSGFRIALAASLAALVLITYVSTRPDTRSVAEEDPKSEVLENLALADEDFYLFEFLEEESLSLNETEPFLAQASEYLAMNDIGPELLFED